jgi:signal transduction histidine kinase
VRPEALLISMAALYAVVSAAAGGAFVAADRRDAHHDFINRYQAVTTVLAEQVGRGLDVAELVAVEVAERASDLGLVPAAATLADRRGAAAVLGAAAPVSNFYLVDSSGHLVLDAKGFHPVGTDFSERDWVRTLIGDPAAGRYIGRIGFDDASRTFGFPIATRVNDHRGTFIGIAAAAIDIDAYKQAQQRLAIGASVVLGVSRPDGTVLVRQPLRGAEAPAPAPEDVHGAAVRGGGEAWFPVRLADEPVERTVFAHLVPGRDIVVWMAVGGDTAVEAWRMRALGVALAVLVTWLAMGALGVTALYRLRSEHRASEHLANLNRDLERSNADLEQFAYVASHDLKEPLRNIASYVQLLQRRYHGRLDPDADAFIGYTVDGVARLQSIINELLAYSRIGTGQLTLLPVQAGILVSTALAHLKGVIAEAQAVVEVKGPLPVVEADATQLGSLFQNLIANALKYRRDDVRPEVVIGCDDNASAWEFYVRDNGIGIDAQYHQQIFDLFKRLHPRDRYSGTGIGLAICQRVVERHGGRIWVESRPGEGSTFRFTLPKRQVS